MAFYEVYLGGLLLDDFLTSRALPRAISEAHCFVAAAGPWSSTQIESDEAVLDSGSSTTLLNSVDFFDEATYSSSTARITMANGSAMTAAGQGMACLRLTTDKGNVVTVRVRALHCPDIPHNLVGLSSLIDEGWCAHFAAHEGHLIPPQGGSGVPIQRRHTLWVLPLDVQPHAELALAAPINLSPLDLIHLRFGHIYHEALLQGCRYITGLPRTLQAAVAPRGAAAPCHECLRAKSSRTGPGQLGVLFHESADEPLAVINIDLSGPHRSLGVGPTGQVNVRYSLIIVDSFSRMRWDLPLTAKSDVVDALRDWLNYVHSISVYRVRRIHGDHDSTFTSTTMKALCEEFNIGQSWSSVDEPRQNPLAERSIGITTALARSMLATSNAPLKLWWFARQYACEIANMFALSHDAIPFEVFFQKLPNGSLYFPFGCFAWIWRDRKHSEDPKFLATGYKGIIIGTGLYDGRKAFRVYTDDGKVKYAVSVTVDQTYFPYRPAGERRLTSSFFNNDMPSTEHFVSWSDSVSPIDRFDVVYAEPDQATSSVFASLDDFADADVHSDVDVDVFAPPDYATDCAARGGPSIATSPVFERDTQCSSVANDSESDDDDNAAKVSRARSENLKLPDGKSAMDFLGRRTESVFSGVSLEVNRCEP